jgi:imidazolonepropionase-like amidohydrolase
MNSTITYRLALSVSAILLTAATALAQIEPAPDRTEGEGPFDRLVLRGATLIDGTGAPPIGPVDIVVEQNRITDIVVVGHPGVSINPDRRPDSGDRELDLSGHFVLPGFVDLHGHIGGTAQGTPAEYVYKLWLSHGITTIRDPGSGNGLEWTLSEADRSARNEIAAPRIYTYRVFGTEWDRPIVTPDEAREWVREMAGRGMLGIKFFGAPPEILKAALDEANKLGLGTTMHHAQMHVTRMNALQTASYGLNSMQHWYGLPEAMFTDRTVQDYPVDYNYQDEQDRFSEAGKLWRQAAPPYSAKWSEVMDSLIALDFTIVPTFNTYEATRDVMRAYRLEWHDEYTLPSLWEFFRPNRAAHGAYYFDWTTGIEVDWRENYRLWMTFVNEFKNRGGRVGAGSDSGYTFNVYGFGFIRELELLQEAGFHPLEVIWSATLKGAEEFGEDDSIGSVQIGKMADFVIVDANPLKNFKVLYGTGAIRVNDVTGEVERYGGVKYTIKDGIIFDAAELRADVREIVANAKAAAGIPPGPMQIEGE